MAGPETKTMNCRISGEKRTWSSNPGTREKFLKADYANINLHMWKTREKKREKGWELEYTLTPGRTVFVD